MAAENLEELVLVGDEASASMRPRRMAAENPGARPGGGTPSKCFNEAAAHGRGKRGRSAPAPGRGEWLQ